eukprot:3782564-Ditylum_brightwellii.AAC.1
MVITIIGNIDATKIQALIQGFLCQQQLHLKSNNLPDPITEQGHFEELQHLDNLLRRFNSDFTTITNKFCQIMQPSYDINPDHDILWPRQGPDPVFQLKQADIPVSCYVDIQLMAKKLYNTTMITLGIRFFDS